MSNKKRLYEVFSKVTGAKLNEQEGMSQEQWDEFSDSVEYGIKDHFKKQNSIFNDGIPGTINETVWDVGEIEMKLNEEDDIQFVDAMQDQIHYVANYNAAVNNIPIIIRMPFTVFIEKDFSGGNVKFYTKTAFTPIGTEGYNEMEVEIGK